jgi:peptide/nickel transport system permease protein
MAVPQIGSQAEGIAPASLKKAAGQQRLARLSRLLRENKKATAGLTIVLVFVIIAIIGPFVAPYNPSQMAVGPPMQPPSPQHWLGTTKLGQDILSQLLVGTRESLLVGFGVGILSTIIAVLVGMTAGYLGGWVDEVLMLLTNIFLVLPFFPLAIVAASYAQAFNIRGIAVIIVVLTLTGWAWAARVKRSQTLALRNRDFILAAQVSGESWYRIILSEILPNMGALVAASFIFATIFAVLGEAGLEFIGLGDISAVTWGTMLYWAQNNEALLLGAWYWFIPPGLCIGLFAVGLTLLNYAIDEMTNPRLRVQKVPRARAARMVAESEPQQAAATEGKPDATIA